MVTSFVSSELRTSDDDWNLSEVARLPAAGEALTTLAPGTFAALSQKQSRSFHADRYLRNGSLPRSLRSKFPRTPKGSLDAHLFESVLPSIPKRILL